MTDAIQHVYVQAPRRDRNNMCSVIIYTEQTWCQASVQRLSQWQKKVIVFKLGSNYRSSLRMKKSKEINLNLSTLTDTNQQFHCQSLLLTVHLVRTLMTLSPLPRVFVGYVALIPTNTCWVRVCIDFQNYRVKCWITVLHSGLPWKGVNPEGTQRSG